MPTKNTGLSEEDELLKAADELGIDPEQETRELLVEVEYAYQVAIDAAEVAATAVERAALLHLQGKQAIRASMRSGGALTFAKDLPLNVQRRAALDIEVRTTIQRLGRALQSW